MSIEEFDTTGFTGGMKVLYKNQQYDIVMVDFEEKLIGINEIQNIDDSCDWKRCENIELIS